MKKTVFIGYDSPYPQAFAVAARSVRMSLKYTTPSRSIQGLHLQTLIDGGLYTRPTERDAEGRLVDVISGAPMATEFALSRFLVPHLAGYRGVAAFMDCDQMVLGNILEPFAMAKADPSKAVWVVKHQTAPIQEAGVEALKMDGQVQTWYARKFWSSFMVFNCAHPKNARLTLEAVNSARGLDLQQFAWLEDDEIGELPEAWNWLVGLRPEPEGVKNVHWTLGGPWLGDFSEAPYAREWHDLLSFWVQNPDCLV